MHPITQNDETRQDIGTGFRIPCRSTKPVPFHELYSKKINHCHLGGPDSASPLRACRRSRRHERLSVLISCCSLVVVGAEDKKFNELVVLPIASLVVQVQALEPPRPRRRPPPQVHLELVLLP